MNALFIFVVIHVSMASATQWHQHEPVYLDNGVKFWTYPFNSNYGDYGYGDSNNQQLNYIPFYLPYADSTSQGPAAYNVLKPVNEYTKNSQNHYSAANSLKKTGTENVAFSIYGVPVKPLPNNPDSNEMYLPGLNIDHNGSGLYIPSIDYVIKKLLLRLRNPWKKMIDIENALNLRSSYEPYWDSIIDEFVDKYFETNPGLSNSFQGTDTLNIVTNFSNVVASFTDFLKLRWGIPMLNSNKILKNLLDSLVNYKTTPENLGTLYKEEITQNYFNNKDQHSSFHETEQLGAELNNQQKIPGSMPPFKIVPINPNEGDKINTLINNNEYSSADANSIVKFNKYFNNYDIYGPKTKYIIDNISKNKDSQNSGMNTDVDHNYAPRWNSVWIHKLPLTTEPTSTFVIDSNNYNINEENNGLNEYAAKIDNMNNLKNICERLAPIYRDLATILNESENGIQVDNLKRLLEIVRQFRYIYNLDSIPFPDTVNIIGNILLDNDNLNAIKIDVKNGLQILLDEFQYGELGNLLNDVKNSRVNDLKLAIDRLGNLLHKYKQSLIREGISEMSINLLLRIAINKCEKILNDYFAEECKRQTSDYILKSLNSVLNSRNVLGGK